MMDGLAIALPLCMVYAAFWLWWGGNGQPMTREEVDAAIRELEATGGNTEHHQQVLNEIRELMASDDGKSFIMQNLVRYRPKALYPPGTSYGDDPREADKRYGKSIMGDLLRHGNLLLFVARRSGSFITPEGADAWHYVAMVRYRSRRDFLKFAHDSSQGDKFIHKWAAIEKTHVFPVKPLISLFAVRTLIALFLFSLGATLMGVLQ